MRMLILALAIFVLAIFVLSRFAAINQKRANLKREIEQATSQVAVLGEKLSRQIDEDGHFIQTKDTEKDPWGNDIKISYTANSPVMPTGPGKGHVIIDTSNNVDTLTIFSNGPDGLPYTKDDIGLSYKLITKEYLKAKAEEKQQNKEKNIEGNSSALTRGLTKGVLDAWKNRK